MRNGFLMFMLVISGCAAEQALVHSVMDPATGITHWQPAEPVVFDHAQPELAATGSDHVLIAPVAVSRQGERRQYLWLGIASSIDRALTGAQRAEVVSYVLMVDDKPMVLDVLPWQSISRVIPFETSVPVSEMLAARVSASQLELLSSAKTLSIVLTADAQQVFQFNSRSVAVSQNLFAAAISASGSP